MSNTALNYIQVGDQTYNIGGTGGSTNGGYPIVTVEDNFNITAEPNTFYDIRNTEDTVINIEMDTNIYSTSYRNQSYYCFSGESS
jgi:hypothetical protein